MGAVAETHTHTHTHTIQWKYYAFASTRETLRVHIISLRRHTQFACVHNVGIKIYTQMLTTSWVGGAELTAYTAISVCFFIRFAFVLNLLTFVVLLICQNLKLIKSLRKFSIAILTVSKTNRS